MRENSGRHWVREGDREGDREGAEGGEAEQRNEMNSGACVWINIWLLAYA